MKGGIKIDQFLTILVHCFKWILVTSLLSSIIAVFILFIRALFKKKLQPRWFVWLWLILVIRLMLPWVPESSFSLFNLFTPSKSDAFIPFQFNHTLYSEPSFVTLQPRTELDTNTTSENPTSSNFHPIIIIAAFIWLAVMVIGIIQLYRSNRQFSKCLDSSRSISELSILELFQKCKQKSNIHSNIRLMASPAIFSPALYGLWRPKLILPSKQLQEFSKKDLSFIFYHELAHFKHRDIGVNWLMTLMLLLHWFNPLLWYCYSRMREDQELSSDAFALSKIDGDALKDYGNTILKVIQSNMDLPQFPRATNFISTKSQMVRRMKMIRSFRKEKRRWFLVGIFLVAIVSAVSLSNAKIFSKSVTVSIPAGWEVFQQAEAEMIYVPKEQSEDGLSLTVVNYKMMETEMIETGSHTTITQLEHYKQSDNLESWLKRMRDSAARDGVDLQQITDPEIGPLLIDQNEAYLHVISFLYGPEPQAISLKGSGKYYDLDVIKQEGVYKIFQQMVSEVQKGSK
ncbi:M56 family metallopeptidase [Lederbergia wuyishanensis]|uniref:Beta-lactamase regulating signal transducer with metallopeptidase domain n=1 Tax=Lederbergia wuyishanensis TaxID=1347903 RepID=A0ABU0DAN1_9BACI|nr:M56 family metallopeptidase [Lederbergia wuyishanensis]MCJ8009653.1 M56 family metallopeptidase [Lederbergia wuyishanensis]MDQ0345473.1 beta-lactamase regulating signal transducer with metallopeptidase domain [Lederbergia wuyishanensis]